MRKIMSAIAALTIVITLSACSAGSTPAIAPEELLADKWGAANATAHEMAADLTNLGICVKTFQEADGVYGSDSLREYRESKFIQCNNWGANDIPNGMTCPASFYISSPGAEMYDPKRPLDYEDGSAVAIIYNDQFQISFSHANSGMEDGSKLASECSGVLDKLSAAVGGEVTRYGDYAYDETSTSTNEESQPQPQVEQVQMPNLVGALDGQAKNWLFTNGYKFVTSLKSTGFNPKTSCMLSGKNVILGQSISAGSVVNNNSSTMVWLTVDCEW